MGDIRLDDNDMGPNIISEKENSACELRIKGSIYMRKVYVIMIYNYSKALVSLLSMLSKGYVF